MELDPDALDHAEVGQGGTEVVRGRTDEPVLLEQTSRLQGRDVVRGSSGVRAVLRYCRGRSKPCPPAAASTSGTLASSSAGMP